MEPLREAWNEFRSHRLSHPIGQLCECTITSKNCSASLHEWCHDHFLLIEAVKRGEIVPTRQYKGDCVYWLNALYIHCSTHQMGESDIGFVTALFREAESHGVIAHGGADNFVYDIHVRKEIDRERGFTANAFWQLFIHQLEHDNRLDVLYRRQMSKRFR